MTEPGNIEPVDPELFEEEERIAHSGGLARWPARARGIRGA